MSSNVTTEPTTPAPVAPVVPAAHGWLKALGPIVVVLFLVALFWLLRRRHA